jgi:hypothetical protein
MKKTLLLVASLAFATAASAQTTPTTKVDQRANGTVEVETKNPDGSKVEMKSGRTNTGEVLNAGAQGTKKVAKKTGNVVKKGFKKTKRGVQKGSNKVAEKAKDAVD